MSYGYNIKTHINKAKRELEEHELDLLDVQSNCKHADTHTLINYDHYSRCNHCDLMIDNQRPNRYLVG